MPSKTPQKPNSAKKAEKTLKEKRQDKKAKSNAKKGLGI